MKTKNKNNGKAIGLRIDHEVNDCIEEIARQERRSASQIIRFAIEEYIKLYDKKNVQIKSNIGNKN